MRFETIAREQAVAVSSLLDAVGCSSDDDPVRSLRSLLGELSALSRRDVGPVLQQFARWAEAKHLPSRLGRNVTARLQNLLDAAGLDALDAPLLDDLLAGDGPDERTIRAFSLDTRTVLPPARIRKIVDPLRAVPFFDEGSGEVVVADLPFSAFASARTPDPALVGALEAARPAPHEILVAFCEWPEFARAAYLSPWLDTCGRILGRDLSHFADRPRGDRTLAVLALPSEGPQPIVAFAPMVAQAADGTFDADFTRSAVRGAIRTHASRT